MADEYNSVNCDDGSVSCCGRPLYIYLGGNDINSIYN